VAIKRNHTNNIVVLPTETGEADLTNWEIQCKYREKGIGQVGHHFIVLRNGDVEKGRPKDEHGNMHPLYNKDSVFVSVLCTTRKQLTEAQEVSIKGLIEYLENIFTSAEELNLITE